LCQRRRDNQQESEQRTKQLGGLRERGRHDGIPSKRKSG
jgi:hypothetical protein